MQAKKPDDVSPEEWVMRKMRAEEFLQACLVDDHTATLVDEAERSGQIDMQQARQLWRSIAAETDGD